MVLPHTPFVPTPDNKEWGDPSLRYKGDTAYFKTMVSYVDKVVGKIYDHLVEQGLEKNTLFIFTADNGTDRKIVSGTVSGTVKGGKGTTLDRGTHVPLVMIWPEKMKKGKVTGNLVEFSDFFATFADIVDDHSKNDGHSLLSYLQGKKYEPRDQILVHHDPDWSKHVNQYRNRFSRSREYKLYQDGKFFHIPSDPEEKTPISESELKKKTKKIKQLLQEELDKAQDLLDNTSGLEWWELAAYFPTDPYEKPDDYYDRTVHTTNPGVLVLSQIENYHEDLLKLPELDTNSFDTVSPYE